MSLKEAILEMGCLLGIHTENYGIRLTSVDVLIN